ncbi:MAG: hypothetical protein GY828_03185 [Candidatus Gracilibacteria bacterium]|nr:hypothetical protein [Candidatus Gracilibacteria bacterium]
MNKIIRLDTDNNKKNNSISKSQSGIIYDFSSYFKNQGKVIMELDNTLPMDVLEKTFRHKFSHFEKTIESQKKNVYLRDAEEYLEEIRVDAEIDQREKDMEKCSGKMYSYIGTINNKISMILPVFYDHSLPMGKREDILMDFKNTDNGQLFGNYKAEFSSTNNYHYKFPGRENGLNVNGDKMPFTGQLFNFGIKEEKDI